VEPILSVNPTESLWTKGALTEDVCVPYLTTFLSQYQVGDGRVLLVNSLSGAVDVVSGEIAELLQDPGKLSAPLRMRLQERAYFFDTRESELQALARVYDDLHYRAEELPLSFIICPTYQCNFRCPYCYEGTLTSSTQLMSEEQLSSLFSAIEELRAQFPGSPVELELFGGEPLQPATEAVVARVFAFAREKDYPVRIVTNGGSIEHFAPMLLEYRDLISRVLITLDGRPELHNRRRIPLGGGDSFSPIVKGIDILAWMGIPLTIGINADAQNIDHIPWVLKLCEEKGWTKCPSFSFSIQPIDDRTQRGNVRHMLPEHELVQRVQEYWSELEPLWQKIDLAALLTILPHLTSVFGFLGMDRQVGAKPIRRYGHYCWVTTEQVTYYFGQDGLIYLCPVGVGIPQLSVGRFHPQLEIHPEAVALWKGRNAFRFDECSSCRVGPMCGGGCAVTSILNDKTGQSKHCGDTFKVFDGFVSDMVLPVIRGDKYGG